MVVFGRFSRDGREKLDGLYVSIGAVDRRVAEGRSSRNDGVEGAEIIVEWADVFDGR